MSAMRARLASPGWFVLLLCVLTAAAAPVAYFTLFAQTPFLYDDEGYFLVSIKLVAAGQRLYDDVASGYGPVYYLAFVPLSKLLGGIGHDDGRWIVLVLWLAGSWTSAVAVLRLTGSVLVAGIAFALTFKICAALGAEPMNPAALLNLLLLGMVVCATFVGPKSKALVVLAVLVMLAGLIKINVGAFAGIALLFALLAGSSQVRRRTYWVGGFVLLALFPAFLLAGDLGKTKAYMVLVVLSGVGVVVAAAAGPRPRPALHETWLRLVAALVGTAAAVALLTMLAFGSTPNGLWQGTVRLAFNSGEVFTIFKPVTLRVTLLALALIPIVLRRLRAGTEAPLWESLVRLAAGAILIADVLWGFEFGGHGFEEIEWLLPVAWLVALPDPRASHAGQLRFARIFVAALAVTESLYAYPVAGTQRAFASVHIVAVGAICLADGARMLAPWLERFDRNVTREARLALAAALLALVVWTASLGELRWVRMVYNAELSVDAPGTNRLRADDDFIDRVRWVRKHTTQCSTFIPIIGLNSMYLWTEKPPPAFMQQNWPASMSQARQARIVQSLRDDPRVCVLVNINAARFWTRGYKLPPGPLVDFARTQFRQVARSQWTDQVWVRKN